MRGWLALTSSTAKQYLTALSCLNMIRFILSPVHTGHSMSDMMVVLACPLNLGRYSTKAARIASGGLCNLTKMVCTGQLDNGFAFIRPPGHHAEKDNVRDL